MNRRSLLGLMLGSLATPALPAFPQAAPSAAAMANVNRYTYGLALLHTRIEPGLTIGQIADRFRLSPAQAKTLAQRMVTDGHAREVGGVLRSTQPLNRSRHIPRVKNTARRKPQTSPLMTHLHQICRSHGLTLSPRCALPEVML